jgi:SSS family solute:Na+ symporter
VVIIFLLGFFDRRANEASAYAVLVGSVVASLVLKMSMPDLPFVLRIWLVFLLNVAFGVVVSRLTRAPEEGQPVVLGDIRFGTSQGFNVASIAISLILVLIYAAFW